MTNNTVATELKLIRMLLEHLLENTNDIEYTRYKVQKQKVFAEQNQKGYYL